MNQTLKTKFEKVIYIGEPRLTRGDNGERIDTGRLSPGGSVYVQDATYGWYLDSSYSPDRWKKTGETVDSVFFADW
ncbi:MAG: hypothetical protein A2065_00015 [Alphaproteobacteria bacterium GWB1_45_5]|nr:MAG: hypothetical protein A2065_00015 [Alphaproteobacteria bacterium GWB1_45_5]